MRLFGIEFCAVFGITDPVHDSAPRSYRQPRGEDNRSLVAPRSDFGTKSRFLSSQTEFSLWDAPSRTQQPPIARSQEPRHSHFGAEPLRVFHDSGDYEDTNTNKKGSPTRSETSKGDGKFTRLSHSRKRPNSRGSLPSLTRSQVEGLTFLKTILEMLFSKITVFYFREEEVMKIRLLLALVGLAISFALPT